LPKDRDFAEASAAAVFNPENRSARIYPARSPSASPLLGAPHRVSPRRKISRPGALARAIADAASDLDPVERRMVASVTARALQQVFA
jgi:hypothetical protein